MAIYHAPLGHVELPEIDDSRPRKPAETRVDRRPATRRRLWEA